MPMCTFDHSGYNTRGVGVDRNVWEEG